MTERTHDSDNLDENHGRPEGQDASETMNDAKHDSTDDATEQSAGTTAVLPAPATPPTQEIAHATQQIPEGPAPEGVVHPAYGAAAARVQAQEAGQPATEVVQDAPTHDGDDPLSPLRDPAPDPAAQPQTHQASSGVGQPGPAPAQPAHPTAQVPAPGAAQGAAQPAAQSAPQQVPRRGPRVGTAVWGLIVIAIGLGILAVSAGAVFDLGAALIVLLGAAGVILVVGSVVSSLRRR